MHKLSNQPLPTVSGGGFIGWLSRKVTVFTDELTVAYLAIIKSTTEMFTSLKVRIISLFQPLLSFCTSFGKNKLYKIDALTDQPPSYADCAKLLSDIRGMKENEYHRHVSPDDVMKRRNGELVLIDKDESAGCSFDQSIKSAAKTLAYFLKVKSDFDLAQTTFNDYVAWLREKRFFGASKRDDKFVAVASVICWFDDNDIDLFEDTGIEVTLNWTPFLNAMSNWNHKVDLKGLHTRDVDDLARIKALVTLFNEVKHSVDNFENLDSKEFLAKYEFKFRGDYLKRDANRYKYSLMHSLFERPVLFFSKIFVSAKQCYEQKSLKQRIRDEHSRDELMSKFAAVYLKQGDCDAELDDLITYLEHSAQPSLSE